MRKKTGRKREGKNLEDRKAEKKGLVEKEEERM